MVLEFYALKRAVKIFLSKDLACIFWVLPTKFRTLTKPALLVFSFSVKKNLNRLKFSIGCLIFYVFNEKKIKNVIFIFFFRN